MNTLLMDIRFGTRMLLKNPGFTAIAALTLALGIGANTAIFSLVYSLIWRPMSYAEPEQLVTLRAFDLDRGNDTSSISLRNFFDWRDQATTFESMGLYTTRSYNLSGIDHAEQVRVVRSTASLLHTLGVEPQLGRVFDVSEEAPGQDRVVLLFHEFWQRRYGGDPTAVGRTITLNEDEFTIIGVLPSGLMRSWGQDDLWAPLGVDVDAWPRANRSHRAFGRIKNDVTQQQAQAEMTAIAARLGEAFPEENAAWTTQLRSIRDDLIGENGGLGLSVLMGAVFFVLLIACANVANLLLSRATSRRAELAVRSALGAGRGRLIRQLLTECVILATTGGVLGIVLAHWGLQALQIMLSTDAPLSFDLEIDRPVLLFTLALTLVSAFAFGLLPALLTTGSKFAGTILETARMGAGRIRRRIGHDVLVVGQLALALGLVVSAGFMVKSFLALNRMNLGFDTENLLTMRLTLPYYQFDTDDGAARYLNQLQERITALPGVEHASAVWMMPVAGGTSSSWATIEGYDNPDPSRNIDLGQMTVTPGYFDAMGIPLLEGRDFKVQDDAQSLPVVIVNRTLAERFWPGESAIGHRLRWGPPTSTDPMRTVIGVVENVRYGGIVAVARSEVFDPFAQVGRSTMTLAVRTEADPAAMASTVQEAIWGVDPNQVMYLVRTMGDVIGEQLGDYNALVQVLSTLAFVALFLASVGLYGVMSYSVHQRTRELGIRMALGAQSRDVVWLVLRKAIVLTILGSVAGLLLGAGIGVLMQSVMFGVTPADPTIFGVVMGVLVVVAITASYVPARRAIAVNPIEALRYE